MQILNAHYQKIYYEQSYTLDCVEFITFNPTILIFSNAYKTLQKL